MFDDHEMGMPDITGRDDVGDGIYIPEQKSHRAVRVHLPAFPHQHETARSSDGPVIEVEVDAVGPDLDVEVKVTGDVNTSEEYAAVMTLLADLI